MNSSMEVSLTHPSNKMMRKKLCALAGGLHTDCMFLVGQTQDELQLFHAFKSDLKLASDVFEAMLRSPLTGPGPIRIKNIRPEIFKMLMEYVHVHTLVNQIIKLEDAVDLALVADEYLIDPLKNYCSLVLENFLRVENIWFVLNAVCHIPEMASRCSEILSTKTKKCLEQPSFKQATLESLIFFLQLDTLTVNSEMELVNACLKLIHQTEETNNTISMRLLLPHLRLLTLNTYQVSQITQFLTNKEKSWLLRAIAFNEISPKMPKTLCPITKLRRGVFAQINDPDLQRGIIEIIPKELLAINFHNNMKNGIYRVDHQKDRNVVKFVACRRIRVTGIEFLARTNILPGDEKKIKTSRGAQDYEECLGVVMKKTMGNRTRTLSEEKIQCRVFYNTPFLYRFKRKINLDRGSQFSLTVTFQKGSVYSNYFTGSVGADLPKNRSIVYDKREILTIRSSVKHETEIFEKWGAKFWKTVPTKKAICVVRGIHCSFL